MYWASVLPTPHHCAKHRSPLARCRAAGGQGVGKGGEAFLTLSLPTGPDFGRQPMGAGDVAWSLSVFTWCLGL